MRFRSKALITAAVVTLLALVAACGGVDSGGEAPTTAREVSAFRSLRLGQTDSPNSPVATTAAANNGEAIILLNRAPGSTELVHLLYVTPSSRVARISIGANGLPTRGGTATTILNFSDYTDETVTVRFEGSTTPITVTLPFDVRKLIREVQTSRTLRPLENNDVLNRLLQSAIVAVRIFGCSGGAAGQQTAVADEFSSTAGAACDSLLIDLLLAIIAESDYEQRAVFGLDEVPTCDFTMPGWADDFSLAQSCALGLAQQLLDMVRTLLPSIDIIFAPTPTPTPTPEPTSTPRPRDTPRPDPTASATPTPTPIICTSGQFQCADGSISCRENICNGTADCADGSDESGSVCTPDVVCCITSGNCPGETPESCAPGCCCCGAGALCDSSQFGGGCIPFTGRSAPEEAVGTLRKLFTFDFLTEGGE